MNKTKLEAWIAEVEGIGELTLASLNEIKLCRLNALLTAEKLRCGFYSGLPERLGSLAELSELPFTTADQLNEHGSSMLMRSQTEISRIISDSTSGSTGPAKRVFYTEGDLENTVGFFAAGISEMASAGDSVLIAMPFSGTQGLFDLICSAVSRIGAVPVPCGSSKSFGEVAEIIRGNRTRSSIGMPAHILSFLRFLGGDSPMEHALISGDACPPVILSGLDSLLRGRLFPHYGSREMCLGGAVSCPANEGMHIRENHIIAEIIGDDGLPLPDGIPGELVVTTIGMEAIPLIRYRTGDTARILPEPCPCGGVTRRLASVSRKACDAVLMQEFDNTFFALPELVDYSAKKVETTVFIEALTTRNIENNIRDIAAAFFPQFDFQVSSRICAAHDRLFYPGKRSLR